MRALRQPQSFNVRARRRQRVDLHVDAVIVEHLAADVEIDLTGAPRCCSRQDMNAGVPLIVERDFDSALRRIAGFSIAADSSGLWKSMIGMSLGTF